tara:strand:+ start:163 stop:615 length:453 start_codon:yes stop_codon:yes gene_type:complete
VSGGDRAGATSGAYTVEDDDDLGDFMHQHDACQSEHTEQCKGEESDDDRQGEADIDGRDPPASASVGQRPGDETQVVACEGDIGDSMAAADPFTPIAIPTVAIASAGASLMPSPTIAVGRVITRASIAAALSAGSCSARTSVIPASPAIA